MVRVSVIVPVYNVKEYLAKCIDSLINQSYSEYEIILVDDGSNDGSEMICDEYAQRNNKVKVFHKKNGGLSDARNYGIKHSESKYIIFVDSDDYVDSNYIEYLNTLISKYSADMAVTGFVYEKNDIETFHVASKREQCVNNEIAFQKMCYGNEIPIMAWGKIMKRDLLMEYPFPYGVLNEDVGTIYKIILNSEKIAVGCKATYHYVLRNSSILHSDNKKKFFYGVKASNEILREVKRREMSQDSLVAAYGRILIESIGLLHRTVSDLNVYKEASTLVKKSLKKKIYIILFDNNLSLSKRLQIFIFMISSNSYRIMYLLKKKE